MVQRAVMVAILAACAALGIACGDDGGGTSDPTQPPSSSPPAATAQNPCPAPRASLASLDGTPSAKASQPTRVDPRSTLADILARHQEAQGRPRPLATASPVASADVGEIAVIQDEGDLVTPANTFDLQGTGLRFTPRSGGYDVSRIDGSFQSAIGDPITLQDDDSVSQTVSFNFTFYGVARNTAFVNSDGNITFGAGDNASTARSVGRMLTGSPRVGPFFADLDPSAGGGVYVRSGPDAFTVTWCDVPVFDSPRRTRFQTSLLRDGTIEMKFAAPPAWTAVDGITAISPGGTNNFSPVDLSATGSSGASGGAVGERFSARPDLDLVSLGRKFYTTHADLFDQLLVWTDEVMTPEDAFAFESNISNTITGIGLEIFDFSRTFNSAGRLASLVQMDALSKYPEDPATKFLGENSTLSVMGQEVGHRWLAYLRFSDHNRQPSEALLGRDSGHWSFFFDSDASVMEGNRIQDLGGGSFRTVAAVEKYSLLDQYVMGLARDIDVPKMFYVESPASTTATAESSPRVGVTFTGTRRDVLINDVIEVMGVRSPSADNSPKVIRQAFIYLVSRNRTADPTAIAKVDRFRRAWEPYYAQATGSRGSADTRLQQPGS
jgi:hypothetical protein